MNSDSIVELATARLRLRGWHDSDRAPFAALNGDPQVMRFFSSTMDRAASDALVDRIIAGFDERGWGLWAVELRDTGEFTGFVGLNPVAATIPCAPAIEIGWRLSERFWGQGIAPEAGRVALDFAFEELQLDEVVSFTTVTNAPSRRVMEKLGLGHEETRDFLHPTGLDWWGAPHVLYARRRDQGGGERTTAS